MKLGFRWWNRRTEEDQVVRLADLLGIRPDYWDIAGEHNVTSPETRRALIEAMGYSVARKADVDDSLDRAEESLYGRLLAPVSVHRTGTGGQTAISLTHPVSRKDQDRVHWTLVCEGGTRVEDGVSALKDLTVDVGLKLRTDRYFRRLIPLSDDLPLGYHRLHVRLGREEAESTVIVAPPHAYRPDWLQQGQRLWGVAHQLYALRSSGNWGIGDLSDLQGLCQVVGEAGGSAIGLNPLHALFPWQPERVSPYAPSSRLFRNPLYLDVTKIAEFESCAAMRTLAGSDEHRQALDAARAGDLVDYPAVAALKMEAFEQLFACFQEQHPEGCESARRRDFEAYLRKGGESLRRFALYHALRDHFDGRSPGAWPSAYRRPDSDATRTFAYQNESRIRFFAWLQWETDRQLAAAAMRCADSGMAIGLYNDLAVGVDVDGADAWADGEVYADVRFGAPPDPFSAEGQNWGVPPLNPHVLRDRAYRPFIDILRANMAHAGALRIDHAMWLQQLFWIPDGGSAADGAYVRYPMDDLFGVLALESVRARCLVVGEDLGTVPLGFRERMDQENVLSYRLVRFERYPDGLYCRPSTYPRLSLSTPGSHDLATIAGFWLEKDIDVLIEIGILADAEAQAAVRAERGRDRELLVAALADQGLLPGGFPVEKDIDAGAVQDVIRAVHRFVGRTPAALTMLTIEDILALADQVNVPGTIDAYPNWRRRLPIPLEALAGAGELAATMDAVRRERGTLSPS